MDEIFLKLSEIVKTEFFCQQISEKIVLQDKDEKGKLIGKPVEIKKKGKLVCLELDKKNKSLFPFFRQEVKHLVKKVK